MYVRLSLLYVELRESHTVHVHTTESTACGAEGKLRMTESTVCGVEGKSHSASTYMYD